MFGGGGGGGGGSKAKLDLALVRANVTSVGRVRKTLERAEHRKAPLPSRAVRNQVPLLMETGFFLQEASV